MRLPDLKGFPPLDDGTEHSLHNTNKNSRFSALESGPTVLHLGEARHGGIEEFLYSTVFKLTPLLPTVTAREGQKKVHLMETKQTPFPTTS